MTIVNLLESLEADLLAIAVRVREERSVTHLRSLMAAGCWIYGAGGYGRRIYRLMAAAGIRCLGFIDQRADSPSFAGPSGATTVSRSHFNNSTTDALIIGIHNFSDDLTSTIQWANSVGFSAILTPGELPDLLGNEAGSYWLTERRHTAEHISEIVKLARSLKDEESIEVLKSVATFRLTGDVRDQPRPDTQNQYIPTSLERIKEPAFFVDGGAFDGDTLRSIQRQSIEVSDWIAFEPDLENFSKLSKCGSNIGVTKATFFPCGLGARTEILSFSDGGGSGSHLSNDTAATSQVMVVALDEVLVGAKPTFIKLDVEGAEADALRGMLKTIDACRPSLAISVYHRPSDLWELPSLIEEIYPDVNLYLRQHGYNGFDTVLYVTPR